MGETEEQPRFSGSLSDFDHILSSSSTLKQVNRKLSISPSKDHLLVRFDRFGVISFSGASWAVSPTWAPNLFGHEYKILKRSHTQKNLDRNVYDKVVSPRLASARASKANLGYMSPKMLNEFDSLDLLAVEVFAKPGRAALITVLHQLNRISRLTADNWYIITEFIHGSEQMCTLQ